VPNGVEPKSSEVGETPTTHSKTVERPQPAEQTIAKVAEMAAMTLRRMASRAVHIASAGIGYCTGAQVDTPAPTIS
jgi:hypothetical protein